MTGDAKPVGVLFIVLGAGAPPQKAAAYTTQLDQTRACPRSAAWEHLYRPSHCEVQRDTCSRLILAEAPPGCASANPSKHSPDYPQRCSSHPPTRIHEAIVPTRHTFPNAAAVSARFLALRAHSRARCQCDCLLATAAPTTAERARRLRQRPGRELRGVGAAA
eukprot:scaffold3821_cov134-Isochrysis_galbana.AAC.12